jgi:predicted metal-binding protein
VTCDLKRTVSTADKRERESQKERKRERERERERERRSFSCMFDDGRRAGLPGNIYDLFKKRANCKNNIQCRFKKGNSGEFQ